MFSPREVQARVRSGESAESVAAETGWDLAKVLRYAEPLLDERAFMAQQGSLVEVRRSGGGATLEESCAQQLGAERAASIAWDSFRREDGRWIVTADVPGQGIAAWTYDHHGRNLHPIDDLARALMGVAPAAQHEVTDDDLCPSCARRRLGDRIWLPSMEGHRPTTPNQTTLNPTAPSIRVWMSFPLNSNPTSSARGSRTSRRPSRCPARPCLDKEQAPVTIGQQPTARTVAARVARVSPVGTRSCSGRVDPRIDHGHVAPRADPGGRP
jgi:hypothetical protein